MKGVLDLLVIVLCLVLGAALWWAMLDLPSSRIHLAEQVAAKLDASGVTHPVTAVLLNFRGYDTLIEVMVLFVALIGMLTQAEKGSQWLSAGYRPPPLPAPPFHLEVLQWLARVLVPLMILTAGYLLWAGAHRAGGAFQAAALLAGAGVLLNLAGLLPAWTTFRAGMRAGSITGLLFFVLAAAATAAAPHGHLLQYPAGWAGMLILLIETGLTLSLGLILAGFFLLLSAEASDGSDTEE
ncbi:MAG: sodium:proton antiporter [Nitrosospira sp.]|nr:sodium:proton antiporter [Nitrosospira sp.]